MAILLVSKNIQNGGKSAAVDFHGSNGFLGEHVEVCPISSQSDALSKARPVRY